MIIKEYIVVQAETGEYLLVLENTLHQESGSFVALLMNYKGDIFEDYTSSYAFVEVCPTIRNFVKRYRDIEPIKNKDLTIND